MTNQDSNQSAYISESNTSKAPAATRQKVGSTVYIVQSFYADDGKPLKQILANLLLQNYNYTRSMDSKAYSGYNRGTETHSLAVRKGVKNEQQFSL